jgi:PIN domain nuclease of toxin-antitoxin system
LRLLLDTHVWIWSHLEPERLGKKARAALTKPETELWLSAISVWELCLLAEKGRLALRTSPAEWIERALAIAPMKDAPVTREVALEARALRLSHDDPADRFLAATAAVHELTLVTADERLLGGKGYRTLACG